MSSQLTVRWKGDMTFEAQGPSGASFVMDAYPESGGSNSGPTPVEALIAALAGCAAMDVISILRKKKQEVDSYRVEVKWTRAPEGVWPRPVAGATIKHIVGGPNIDPSAVERAVQLSDEKYCSVMATVRQGAELKSEWSVESLVL